VKLLLVALVATLGLLQQPEAPTSGRVVVKSTENGLTVYWEDPNLKADATPCTCQEQYMLRACAVHFYQVKRSTEPDVRKQSNLVAPQERTSGCVKLEDTSQGAVRYWPFTDGKRGVRYYFVVRAVFLDQSDWSEEVSAVYP
jgi:hypothetical protein